MIPGDISDVPTLNSLNQPQKRALILRDQLRYLQPAHLDSYLAGVSADEPPTYRKINGTVYPLPAQVAIRDEAIRFDLGNVQFPEEGGAVYRAYLTVEDGRFEMRTEDALPRDDADLASVGIHRFVAENMLSLFRAKYKAIHARMEKINEARRVAYNMLDHPPARFEDGETLARLNSAKAREDASQDGSPRKRKEIVKHISNKRQRIGLETIPEAVKSETFNAIPAQVKVHLFDNIIKTAFPNFDSLILASWNVVSVYANVGSDFPDVHRAVLDLKGALEEFESAYAPPRSRGAKREEATPTRQPGSGGSRSSMPAKEGGSTSAASAVTHASPASQKREDDGTAALHRHRADGDDTHQHMRPPRVLADRHEDFTKHPEHRPKREHGEYSPRAHSLPHAPAPTSSTPTSPEHHRDRRPTRPASVDTLASPSSALPGADLMRRRQEHAARSKARNGTINSSSSNTQRTQQGEEEAEGSESEHGCEQARRRPGSGGGGQGGLDVSRSVLGAKKMGGAPVAPMGHVRGRGGAGFE